ncbi:N utilization substance protein B [Borreliella californiensis]|uniref:Transcription antitermination protein NusB n=2 Tax=Borreliella californiensis TaxID=373543 RepID=A0A7X0DRF3_9SPIR|nr:N utilization substance protein B [Borreliella californiensis]
MDLMHEVRVLAFQKIYSIDINQSAMNDIFDIFNIEDSKGLDIKDESIKSFYSSLVNGTFNNLEHIDSLIRDISLNWSLDRMDKVDLAILRMSVYSLKFQNFENSKRVVIDEAILIAKKYGGKNSYKFINGILDALLKNMESYIEKK